MANGQLQAFGPKDEVLAQVIQPVAMPRPVLSPPAMRAGGAARG